MTASQMERRSTVPPSPACLLASGQEMLATTKRGWENLLRWERSCCPTTRGPWPPGKPSTRSWDQSHICTLIPMGTALVPPPKSNSGYGDSASAVLLLFHPPVIFWCSSEITAKLCLFFFLPPLLISFLGWIASQITLHPLTHMHAHTLYRKCLLMRGQ